MVSAEQRWKRGTIAHARTSRAYNRARSNINTVRFRAFQHPNNARAQANLVRAQALVAQTRANYKASVNQVSSAYKILLRKYGIAGILARNQNAGMEELYQRNLPRARESAARKIQSAFRKTRAIRHTRARAPSNLVLQKAMSPTRIGHLMRTYGPNSIRHFQ
jgi:hypothetical protein